MEKSCDLCAHSKKNAREEPCCRCTSFQCFELPPVKTLLDEYAIAAMKEIIAKRPYLIARDADEVELANKIVSADCKGAWAYAAAMMREKMRRDEMGNVKEVSK